MYLAIDVGGTKTLTGVFSASGDLLESVRFETPKTYEGFLGELEKTIDKLTTDIAKIRSCCIALPGLVDRKTGIVQALGNLPWKEKPIGKDVTKILGIDSVILENDARLAGLAEANVVRYSHKNILYLTISTGIGGALIRDNHIVKELQDTEVGKMPLFFDGKIQPWEEFASGRWLTSHFNKHASELTDKKDWQEVGERIALGVGALCTVLQPEAIIFGGGVGQYADKFSDTISEYLLENLHPVIRQPHALRGPHYPGDAVLHGCYVLIKQKED